MHSRVSFACSACQTPFHASLRFVGRTCPCPRCGEAVLVPPQAPEEESSLLVLDDGHPTRRGKFWVPSDL
jgi:DNA-directed RNA polymerase subunit RPC12/RpoP